MPQVLTAAATITCGPLPAHGGAFKPTTAAKLTVRGKAVLTRTPVTAAAADGTCAFKNAATGVAQPCSGPATIAAGFATRLTAGGDPVALSTLTGTATNVPPSALVVTESQTKLSAV